MHSLKSKFFSLNRLNHALMALATVALVGCGGGGGGSSSTNSGNAMIDAAAPSQNATSVDSPAGNTSPASSSTAPALSAATTAPAPIATTYQPDGSTFLNPERGFHEWVILANSSLGAMSAESLYNVRAKGMTLVLGVLQMPEFRDKPLSDTFLNELRQSFAYARKAGVKVIVLAMYNFPTQSIGGEANSDNIDAPLNIALGHLDQLKTIFAENNDVIAGLRQGFIGAWGEWHSSSTGLDKEPARTQMYQKIHEILPSNRMMSVRYVQQLKEVTNYTQVDLGSAYSGSYASRTGLSNTCFLASPTDVGMYQSGTITEEKDYLQKTSRYVMMYAETCEMPAGYGQRDDCATARAELRRFNYSIVNGVYYTGTLNRWKNEGCYNEINNSLGYRFELQTSTIDSQVQAGNALNVSFVVKNLGYAAPYNPRGLALVLRNQQTGQVAWLPVRKDRDPSLDPRMWFADVGNITVNAQPVIPATLPAGTYDVLLSLHDPIESLAGRPEYSIRLANKDLWEAESGWNFLARGVTVTK